MKLYKFRALGNEDNLKRVKEIIEEGFHCNDVLGFNDMNEGVYTRNSKNENIKLEKKLKYKICSFSGVKALKSELMWGHYANAGKGVVIEIDVENSRNIKEVNYDDNNNLSTLEEILTNKSKEWIYEDEYRYLSKNSLTNNKVKIGKICKIYFGTPYERLTNYKDIKNNHTKLQEYLKLKDELKEFCVGKTIDCEDFIF